MAAIEERFIESFFWNTYRRRSASGRNDLYCGNSVEMVRLTNSGTEASMAAIRVARGYTGRDKIIKFEDATGSVDSYWSKQDQV